MNEGENNINEFNSTPLGAGVSDSILSGNGKVRIILSGGGTGGHIFPAIANMAVNVNLVPVTGVTLPLVSMGGSSFLFTCLSIGIILSVARNVEQLEGKKELAKEAVTTQQEEEPEEEVEEEEEDE